MKSIKNRYVKRILYYTFVFMIVIFIFMHYNKLNINGIITANKEKLETSNRNQFSSSSTMNKSEYQQAIQEVAYAYYMRGANIQYNQPKGINLFYSPEEATVQNMNYTVCSGFTKNVYYELLGIKIPNIAADLLNYSKNETGSEVVAYGKKNEETGVIKMKFNILGETIEKTKPDLERDIIPYLQIRRYTNIYRTYNDGL